MNRMICFASASALLVLSGCGDGSVTNDDAVANVGEIAPAADEGNIQARLESLPEGQRNGVFIRAIRDTQGDCQHVDRSERAGDYQGLPVWRAHCQGGGDYTIVVTDSGAAQVLNEAEVALVRNEGQNGSAEPAQ